MINPISNTTPTQTIQYAQSLSQTPTKGVTSPDTMSDSVIISNEGRRSLLASKLPSILKEGSIEDAYKEAKENVEKQMQALYQKLGISPETKMDFQVGYDGKIIVEGNDAKSEALENAINANDDLANSIRGMSANASLLKAIEDYEEFAAAYQRNPEKAVARYSHLLDDNHTYNVIFSMQNNQIDKTVMDYS